MACPSAFLRLNLASLKTWTQCTLENAACTEGAQAQMASRSAGSKCITYHLGQVVTKALGVGVQQKNLKLVNPAIRIDFLAATGTSTFWDHAFDKAFTSSCLYRGCWGAAMIRRRRLQYIDIYILYTLQVLLLLGSGSCCCLLLRFLALLRGHRTGWTTKKDILARHWQKTG